MHCCGNPLHDIPANIFFFLPFLPALGIWVRSIFKKKPCACPSKHADK